MNRSTQQSVIVYMLHSIPAIRKYKGLFISCFLSSRTSLTAINFAQKLQPKSGFMVFRPVTLEQLKWLFHCLFCHLSHSAICEVL